MYYILQPLSNHIFVKPIEGNQRRLSSFPACPALGRDRGRQAGAGLVSRCSFLTL